MLLEMWNLFWERRAFFLQLLLEHIEISLAAIGVAIVLGGIVGIFISEYDTAAGTAKHSGRTAFISTARLGIPSTM